MPQPPLLVIKGPTASGKTAWALRLAKHFPPGGHLGGFASGLSAHGYRDSEAFRH